MDSDQQQQNNVVVEESPPQPDAVIGNITQPDVVTGDATHSNACTENASQPDAGTGDVSQPDVATVVPSDTGDLPQTEVACTVSAQSIVVTDTVIQSNGSIGNVTQSNVGTAKVVATDVSLPTNEWFEELFGPEIRLASERAENVNRINIASAGVKQEVIDLSDDEEQNKEKKKSANKPVVANGGTAKPSAVRNPITFQEPSLEVAHDTSGEDAEIDQEQEIEIVGGVQTEVLFMDTFSNQPTSSPAYRIEKPEEMKKIILTRTRLNVLSEASIATFHKAVVGCYVRITVPGVAEHFKDVLFFDQIESVHEAMTYQHFWFNRRFRMANFGDFEIENINDVEVNDLDVRRWFAYVETKGATLPTCEFIERKEKDLLAAMQEIKEKPRKHHKVKLSPSKVKISRSQLEQLILSFESLRVLSKLDYEHFRNVVTGCFVRMSAICKNKPSDCQYHICPIRDCVRSGKDYKLRDFSIVDYQLVFPFYGKYNINWLKDCDWEESLSEDGFRFWIEDMDLWDEKVPTPEQVRTAAAALQIALTEAEALPSYKEIGERAPVQTLSEEDAKEPVNSARDLDRCLLKNPQLIKISLLSDQISLLEKTLVGCFVRLKPGPSRKFEIDQIKRVEIREENQGRGKEIMLHLKSIGLITMKNVLKTASQFPIEEQEFKEWLQKMHKNLDEILPTKEFVEKKHRDIERALRLVAEKEKEEVKLRVAEENGSSRHSVDSARASRGSAHAVGSTKSSSGRVPYVQRRPRSTGTSSARDGGLFQAYSSRQFVRNIPGVRPGYTGSSAAKTSIDTYNMGSNLLQQQQQQNYSLRQEQSQQNDALSLIRSGQLRQYYPTPASSSSVLGKRPISQNSDRYGMMGLWEDNLRQTEQRQRQLQLENERASNFVPFVRAGAILDNAPYLSSSERRPTSPPLYQRPSSSTYESRDLLDSLAGGSNSIGLSSQYFSSAPTSSLLNNFRDHQQQQQQQQLSATSNSSAVHAVAELLAMYGNDSYSAASLAAKRARPTSPLAPPVQRFY